MTWIKRPVMTGGGTGGGNAVADSSKNGNILVDGTELVVFDNTENVQEMTRLDNVKAEKTELPNISNLATKTELVPIQNKTIENENKIKALSSGMTFKGEIETYSDLPLAGEKGDTYIVKADETKNNTRQTYVYDGFDYIGTGETTVQAYDDTALQQLLAELETTKANKGDIPNITGLLPRTEANNTYQPKGNYALVSQIPSTASFLTKTEANNTYQAKGEYATKSELHTHENADVLNKFTENAEGLPLYNGQPLKGESGTGGTGQAPTNAILFFNTKEEFTLTKAGETAINLADGILYRRNYNAGETPESTLKDAIPLLTEQDTKGYTITTKNATITTTSNIYNIFDKNDSTEAVFNKPNGTFTLTVAFPKPINLNKIIMGYANASWLSVGVYVGGVRTMIQSSAATTGTLNKEAKYQNVEMIEINLQASSLLTVKDLYVEESAPVVEYSPLWKLSTI